jgi:hypothetical protein
MSRRMAQTCYLLSVKPGTGVTFARPDCTENGYSFVGAKPDYDRTESLTQTRLSRPTGLILEP